MPRLSDASKEARKLQIAEATLRCLSRQGLASTSMADIIREAGLSAGSIYSHFESKAELLRYAAATLVEARGSVLKVPAGGRVLTPREVAHRTITQVLPDQLRPALLQIWAEASLDEELRPVLQAQLQLIRDLLVEALSPWARTATGSPAAATRLSVARADTVLALMQGYLVRQALDHDIDDTELLENLLSSLEA